MSRRKAVWLPRVSHRILIDMQDTNFDDVTSTRNYLQDIAKVVGKFQQVFLEPEVHYWHVGLVPTASGFKSQAYQLGNSTHEIIVDIEHALIQSPEKSWTLGAVSPRQLFADLSDWLNQKHDDKSMDLPSFKIDEVAYDASHALYVMRLLSESHLRLAAQAAKLQEGTQSPILLYPHHFDVSLSWYPKHAQQFTLGFSTGDDSVGEPYYYVTAYPEPLQFKSQPLPEGAYWQSQGFSGGVFRRSEAEKIGGIPVTIDSFFDLALKNA